MNSQINEYIELLKKYTEVCHTQLESEQEKREALMSGNGNAVEAVLKKQQAVILQINLHEKKRIEIQDAMGCSFMTSSELLDTISDDDEGKSELFKLLKDLNDTATLIKLHNEMSMTIADGTLKMYDELLDKPSTISSSNTYNPDNLKGNKTFSSGTSLKGTI